jgi:hypothetical protein
VKLSISDIAFSRPLVRQKLCTISWIIDAENVAFDLARKDVFGIERVVYQAFKILSLFQAKGGNNMGLKKSIPLFSPLYDTVLLEGLIN